MIKELTTGSVLKNSKGTLYEVLAIADRHSEIYPDRVVFRGRQGEVWTKILEKWDMEKVSDFNIDNEIRVDFVDNECIIIYRKELEVRVFGDLDAAVTIARFVSAKPYRLITIG